MAASHSVRGTLVLGLCAVLCAAPSVRAGPEEERSIAGRVLDEHDAPVPRYEIKAAPPAGVRRHGVYLPRARSDDEGRFEVRGLGPGLYTLIAGDCPTHAKMAPAQVRAGKSDVVLRVLRYRTIAGVARDPAGGPLVQCEVRVRRVPPRPYARVSVQTPGRELLERATKTDDQGRFRIERYPSDQPVLLTVTVPPARHRELLPIVREDVIPGAAALELVAPAALALTGVVQDAGGKPVAGASVRVLGAKRRIVRTRSDAAGRFELRPFGPDARVGLSVEGPVGPGEIWFPLHVKEVRPGGAALTLVLRRGHALTGEIVGVPAASLRGVTVSARGDFRKTIKHQLDGTGTTFRLAPLPAELVDVSIDLRKHPGLTGPRNGPIPVEAPAAGVRIRLAHAHVLRGRVRGPPGLRRIRITYYDAWGRHRQPSRLVASGDAFEIPRLPAGGGQLHAHDGGKHVALLNGVDPAQDAVVLDLKPGVRIRGRILGLPGQVRLGSVTARSGRFAYTRRLNKDGRFVTEPLPPGPWNLEFDVGDPVGGIVPTLKGVPAGTQDAVARWDPDP